MKFWDSIESKYFPHQFARRQVSAMVRELQERERQGDAGLYNSLDELNLSTQALDIENLADAYQAGQKKAYPGAEKFEVRDAIARRQTGFALQLARQAFADSHLDAAEQDAIADIGNQNITLYGACGNLPRLTFQEASQLQDFADAPSDEIRAWMLEVARKPSVEMQDARELAGLILADAKVDSKERAFVTSARRIFGAEVESDAHLFLRGLGHTEVAASGNSKGTAPTLWDEARTLDYRGDENILVGPPCTKHVMALGEAVRMTVRALEAQKSAQTMA